MPLLCPAFGIAYMAVFWIHGDPVAGVGPFAITVGCGVLLLLGGRSKIVCTVRNRPSDETCKSFDVRTSLFSFFVLLVALI